jgi:predicted transcriptional regulator
MGNVRTHVSLPEDLVKEVDRLAGKRKRSQFIEGAVRDKVLIARQREALEKYAGILNPDDYPEWSTPEKASEWVRASRQLDNERWERKVGSRLRKDQSQEPEPEQSDTEHIQRPTGTDHELPAR